LAEVLKAMFMTKLKSALAVVLVLGVMGAGGTSLAYRTAAGQAGKKPVAEKPQEGNNRSSKDLSKVEPPGGVPLPLVEPGTNKIGVDQLSKVRERLRSVPEKALEQWVVELERITDVKLKDGLPSPRQACRNDLVVRMSVAFDDLRWNATAADRLYERACSMRTAEAKAWEEAFESVLKKEIGIEQTGNDEFSNLAGGPPWAVPLVLIPVDALHEGQKYSVERGRKYLARLKQLTKDDVALWRGKIDKFGGTDLDAAVNIILLDEFFSNEQFQRDRFEAAVGRQDDKKPTAEAGEKREKGEGKEIVTAWGTEVGGLQAGLGFRHGERRAYGLGETVTVVLRVRNVGQEAVDFRHIWAFFVENPPTVTDAEGKPVRLPRLAAEGLQRPRTTTVPPGKEVELYDWKFDLRPQGEGGTGTAIHGTGKFGLQCERIVGPTSGNPDHPNPPLNKIATGKLELVVTADPPPAAGKKPPAERKPGKEGVTAWGKEAGGLQAGLGIRPGEKRAYHIGETVTLVVRVRNVGTEPVTFQYIRQYLDENPPTVTGADGKEIVQRTTSVTGLLHVPVDVTLGPGQEVELESKIHGADGWPYELTPAGGGGKTTTRASPLSVGTGKVSFQYERVFGNSSIGRIKLDPTLSKLATGKLDLDIKSDPPPSADRRDVLTPEEAVRIKKDVPKATVEFKVEHVTKSILVKTGGDKEAGWVTGHSPDDLSLRPQPVGEKRQAVFEAILTDKAIKQLIPTFSDSLC
jgi:hypothetical protein